jgi:hypothetical protein
MHSPGKGRLPLDDSHQVRRSRLYAVLALAVGLTAAAAGAGELRYDVGSNDSPVYEKECGSCHFPYQPGWLPERSWRRLLSTLNNHFGDNAEISAGSRDAVTTYLTSRAADHSSNARSREIMSNIKPGETPLSLTKVLYVGGIHGGFLDPTFKGKPEAKTLAQCPLCHQKANRGWFAAVTYTISDESFRSEDTDLDDSLVLLMRRKK